MDNPASSPDSPEPNAPIGPTNGAGSTAELTALAGHLRRMADQINDLERRCAQVVDVVSGQVLPMLDNNAEQLQQLHDTLNSQGEDPADWPTMTAEQAEKVWDNLATWIENILIPWHEINRDQLPDCWALHRPVVIQLVWLYNTYLVAHQPGAKPKLAAEWNTRWLPAALTTIRDAVPLSGVLTCGPGYHLTDEFERERQLRDYSEAIDPPENDPATPTGHLAERPCWQSFYAQAVTADLARRGSASRTPHEEASTGERVSPCV